MFFKLQAGNVLAIEAPARAHLLKKAFSNEEWFSCPPDMVPITNELKGGRRSKDRVQLTAKYALLCSIDGVTLNDKAGEEINQAVSAGVTYSQVDNSW
ncbi:MAG: hypothetical protein WBB23_07275 [Desulforhopalus sp.]